MNEPLTPIYVDDRIGAVEISKHLPNQLHQVRRLEFGDFAFLGRGPNGVPVPVGVERKRIPDLVNSMRSGRLADHQLGGLFDNYQQVWLIVEGDYKIGRNGELMVYSAKQNSFGLKQRGSRRVPRPLMCGPTTVTAALVEGALVSLQTCTSLRVKQTSDEKQTARFLERLHAWWAKPWESHRSLQAMQEVDVGGCKLPVARVAAQIPGIGSVTARGIAKVFGSVAEMVAADDKRWREIDGIGPKTAKVAREFLNGQ